MLSEKLLSDIHNVLKFYLNSLNTKMGLSNCNSLKIDVLNYENLDVEVIDNILKLRLYNPFHKCIYSEIKLDIPTYLMPNNFEDYINNLVCEEFKTSED